MRRITFLLIAVLPAMLFAQGTSRFKQFQAYKYMEEGVTEYDSGNYTDALTYFDQAAEFDPNQKEIYRYRAESRFRLGQYEKSVADYNVAVSLDPNDAKLYNARGMAYARQSLYFSAVQDYNKALKIDPAYTEARRNKQLAERYAGTSTSYGNTDYGNTSTGYSQYGTEGTKPSSANNGWGTSGGSTSGTGTWGSGSTGTGTSGNFGTGQTEEFINPIVGGQAQDYITIQKIKITPLSTFVTFEVKSPRRKSVSIFIHRPGTQGAFYITDATFNQEYKLKGMSGLNSWSTPTDVPARGSKVFTLEFEKIPYAMRTFHLLEGKNPGDKAWNFYQVELK